MLLSFHVIQRYGINRIAQAPQWSDIDFQEIRISFASPQSPAEYYIIIFCFFNFKQSKNMDVPVGTVLNLQTNWPQLVAVSAIHIPYTFQIVNDQSK